MHKLIEQCDLIILSLLKIKLYSEVKLYDDYIIKYSYNVQYHPLLNQAEVIAINIFSNYVN